MSARPLPAMRSLYQELILDHHRRPRHHGSLDGEHLAVHKLNPTCGDEITLHLRIDDDRIVDGRFGGQGCSISQASASMMLSRLIGRSTEEAHAMAARFREMLHGNEEAASDPVLGDLRALAGVAMYPPRVRCAMLAWVAFEEISPAPGKDDGRSSTTSGG